MYFDPEQLIELQDPDGLGVVRIDNFVEDDLLFESQLELMYGSTVAWRDNHKTYRNDAGRTIVENYDVFALRLTQGDQSPLDSIPNTLAISEEIKTFVKGLERIFPALVGWKPDEMALHRYDKPNDIGLSQHRDHSCFTRLIAIASLHGVCDILIDDFTFERANPGDLFLLRAPGLIESGKEVRPLHSVANLYTPLRISLTLRENDEVGKLPKRYHYDNWTKSKD